MTVNLKKEFRTPGLVFELIGYQKAYWEVGHDTEEINDYKRKDYIIEHRQTLLDFEDDLAMAGSYKASFSFQLPSRLPSSFIYYSKSKDTRLNIKYVVRVRMDHIPDSEFQK